MLENLRALPTEIAAVQVLRREASLTGEREMPVVRAFRPESRRGLPHPTVPWAVQGRTVGVDGITLAFRRATYADPVGRAEAAEAGGDLVRAAESWGAIGDILDDAWGAYASMRSALLVARVAPGADLVRARLMRSVERCPNLPEALVAMARWWTARGQTARALEWGQVAAAVHAPARGVPHPTGLGDGWVRRELQGLFSSTTNQGGAPGQPDS